MTYTFTAPNAFVSGMLKNKKNKKILSAQTNAFTNARTHSLVTCKLFFHFKAKRNGMSRKILRVGCIQNKQIMANFQEKLQSQVKAFGRLNDTSLNALWEYVICHPLNLKNILHSSAKRNREWFDENNHKIRQKHQAHLVQIYCTRKLLFTGHTKKILRKIQYMK